MVGLALLEPTENLSDNAGTSVSPVITSVGDIIHVVWQDNEPGNYEILYRRSLDAGSSFLNAENLSDNSGNSEVPAIAAVGDNVHVVWQENSGIEDIFYRKSLDAGNSFFNTENLSNNPAPSSLPAIAVIGNNVHVAWMDSAGASDIFYTRLLDDGATFSSIENVSNNAGFSFSPAIAVLGNNVYLVWADDSTGSFNILYKRSSDNGTTFSNILTNLSLNMGGLGSCHNCL